MKRNIMIAVYCALILYFLTGCQLAKESADTNANDDRLIGVLITTEYLDLFDYDGYLDDDFNSFQGCEINMNEKNNQKYQGRLYADLIPRTITNEETGETTITYEYVFEGIEGIQYCVPTIQATEAENSYVATMSDPAISDTSTNIFVSDDENSISIDGTIFITATGKMNAYYFNPVYQSTDGSVYAVSGDSFMLISDMFGEGSAYSHTLETTTSRTENGMTKKDSTSIKISISVMYAPENIVILQMGSDNAIISLTEYEPYAMPQVIVPETGTAYFIVETHKKDDAGNTKLSREIFDRDIENIETFFARADGVCEKHWTQIFEN